MLSPPAFAEPDRPDPALAAALACWSTLALSRGEDGVTLPPSPSAFAAPGPGLGPGPAAAVRRFPAASNASAAFEAPVPGPGPAAAACSRSLALSGGEDGVTLTPIQQPLRRRAQDRARVLRRRSADFPPPPTPPPPARCRARARARALRRHAGAPWPCRGRRMVLHYPVDTPPFRPRKKETRVGQCANHSQQRWTAVLAACELRQRLLGCTIRSSSFRKAPSENRFSTGR
jgi:hypothetical protein